MSAEIPRYGLIRRQFQLKSLVWFGLLVMAFIMSLAFSRDLDLGRVLFQVSLFSLCAAPYFLLAHEPRYRLVVFFLLVYYAMFGLLDYVLLFTDQDYRIFTSAGKIQRTTFADLVILTGGVSVLVSYLLVARWWGRSERLQDPPHWAYTPSVLFAFGCWCVGITAQFVVQFVYGTTGPKAVGFLSHLVSNLYYLALLGGIIMIITALNNARSRLAWLLLAIAIGVEFIFGFLGNIKEVSFRLVILILIALFFLRGRISLLIVAIFIVVFVPYQSVFSIYRENILQVREKSPLEAVQEFSKSAERISKESSRDVNSYVRSIFFFFDRVDGRKYVEIITQKVGHGVKFLNGETLNLYFYSFIPGALWKNKPQISTGQLMNRTFKLSASQETYVPTTQLGEFYWNFGVPGVLFGMSFVGMFLALVNGVFLSGKGASTVGMLVIMVAFYFLIMRFESGFASQYNQFTRVVVLVGLMAVVFSRLGWTVKSGLGVGGETPSVRPGALGSRGPVTRALAKPGAPSGGLRRK
ncbi:MAG: hypothetical protein P1P84_12190 [Deferrisomatales bacterium]|nr:hypothetical protein [Deferrisomatales bacterium]